MDTKKPRMKKEQQQYLLNFLMRNSETVNRTPQPIVDVPDPHVKQNIVIVLDDAQLPKPKQTLIVDAVTVDIRSDTEEEPPKEAAMVDALTPTASHDGATVVTSMVTDASSIPTASRVGRIAVDALMMPAANRDLATIGCSREHIVASTPEQRLEDGVVRNTPRLERRNVRRATPRTLVPPADSATPQEDAMIAALREGAQALMALANAQTEAARALTNSFMDEDEEPIIVCFICHARLNRCRMLQQQAIESNAVLEQLLAGGSMSIPKPHEARDEIQFTTINHIDIWPAECDLENDSKDDIFIFESVKVKEEKIENENFKFEVNWSHEIDTAEQQENLEIDAFEDRHEDSENDLPLIRYGSKSITDDFDIEDIQLPPVNEQESVEVADAEILLIKHLNFHCFVTEERLVAALWERRAFLRGGTPVPILCPGQPALWMVVQDDRAQT
ncbi:unnamed protein product [Parnassius apollo]|uniref:(apollo) hypothetical protein n=1 Tax=Parnassius apollo TaxID=110799 RepID=A0A8S3YA10_PARAO|nr:unnamed protein product [Parnassius apollo]